VSGQLHAPTDLLSSKELPLHFRWEAGWATEAIWTIWRSNISRNYPTPGLSTRSHPLYSLSYRGLYKIIYISLIVPMTSRTSNNKQNKNKQSPRPKSASELCRTNGRHSSANLVPTFADKAMSCIQRDGFLWPYSRFSRPEQLLFFQVAPQLYPRG
jgi:hypothetical protein